MPNRWTGKGNPYTRKEVVERLRATLKKGQPIIAAGAGTVERGAETYHVIVREVTGDSRDRVYDEQARRYPGFADYAQRTAGIRTIPVLEMRRS